MYLFFCFFLRIKRLIKGKDAYIVPGTVNDDDLYIAEQFGKILNPILVFSYSRDQFMKVYGITDILCEYIFGKKKSRQILAKWLIFFADFAGPANKEKLLLK